MHPPIRRPSIFIALLLLSSACAHGGGGLSAGSAAAPAPHRTGRVAVAPGVRVEYVDWGGRGDPLVFLPGMGNTAHIFDEFAPRFVSGHRVIGITRRGFGASDRPGEGYDTQTLAADVRALLDSLGIGEATLVAHSIGGSEASALAAADPRRFGRVVYLDSYDFGCAEPPRPRQPDPSDPPLPPNRFVRDPLREPLAPADSVSAEAAHAAWVRRMGWSMPLDELRAERGEAPAGARALQEPQVMRGMMMGKERCFRAAPTRALNVFAEVRNPRFEAFDEAMSPVRLDSAQVAALTRGLLALVDADHARFTRQLPGARVVMVPGAHHFIFLSNPAETFAAVQAFLAETKPRQLESRTITPSSPPSSARPREAPAVRWNRSAGECLLGRIAVVQRLRRRGALGAGVHRLAGGTVAGPRVAAGHPVRGGLVAEHGPGTRLFPRGGERLHAQLFGAQAELSHDILR